MKNLIVIAGPCVVEDEKTTMLIAEKLNKLCNWLNITLIFKASYRKANRTSGNSFTGIGDVAALTILAKVHTEFAIDVITDIHEAWEAERAALAVQMLQIPAFLCRQTDLLVAAAATGLPINIKKGQFASNSIMGQAILKVINVDRKRKVYVTERGNSFGYEDIVVDMRNIATLQTFDVPVLVDITHTNGGHSIQSFALGRAAVAAGADGVFFETHPDPSKALSDGKNMIPLSEVENLLIQLKLIKEAIG